MHLASGLDHQTGPSLCHKRHMWGLFMMFLMFKITNLIKHFLFHEKKIYRNISFADAGGKYISANDDFL